MTVLGLGGSGHDWSSCVIHDGRIIALDEERTSRLKYGVGADLMRGAARRRCLDAVRVARPSAIVACTLVPEIYKASCRQPVKTINHHLAHAYSTFYASGFDSAAILVADNAGSIHGKAASGELEVETISLFDADRSGIRLIHRVTGLHSMPPGAAFHSDAGQTSNSLGDLYRAVSLELGHSFRFADSDARLSEDGKTMGLAAYGDDRFIDLFDGCSSQSDGGVSIDPVRVRERLRKASASSFDERAAVARAAQRSLEHILLGIADYLRAATGRRRLCIAGGVGLNSVANGRLLREGPFDEVHIVPAAGDNGISLGCAYYAALHLDGISMDEVPSLTHAYLGPPLVVDHSELLDEFEFEEVGASDPIAFLAARLADGAIVAWFTGPSEFGPRALGHRSILSSPLSAHRRDLLNRSIKLREWFRPYAPVVPRELASNYFDLDGASPYMLLVANVLTPDLPAVTHVDGTARVQTLERSQCDELHALLVAFGATTGHAVLLNTSFNAAGEPIVETARDAALTFRRLKLDYLYLDGVVVAPRDRSGP
jgi:carbamoyltransferase